MKPVIFFPFWVSPLLTWFTVPWDSPAVHGAVVPRHQAGTKGALLDLSAGFSNFSGVVSCNFEVLSSKSQATKTRGVHKQT